MAAFLRQHLFSLLVIAGSVLAYNFPGVFGEVGGFKTNRLIVPFIQIIMFGMGTTLRLSDFADIAKRPWPVAVGVVLQFTVMPLAGLGLATAAGLDGEVAAGVVLIGSAAGGVASNVMAYIAGANVALSVSMTMVSTLAAPVMTPLLMRLLAGRFIEIDMLAMALSLVNMIILPLVVSQAARWAFDRWCRFVNAAITRILPFVSMTAICLIVTFCTAEARSELKSAGLVVFAVAIVHNGLGFLLGYWGARLLGRFIPIDERDCRTVAIEVGMQNAGMSQALALNVLKSPGAVVAPFIFGVWMDFSGSLLAGWWRRRPIAKVVLALALISPAFAVPAAAAGRNAPWPKERAWAWYDAQPWIRGVNFVPSDVLNYVDIWQEFGFERHLETADAELALAAETGFNTVRLFIPYEVWLYEREGFLKRFDRYLDVCARHGLRAIVVLFSDCAPPKENFFLKRMGDQRKVYRGLEVWAKSPHQGGDTVGYNILDLPEHVERLIEMERELLTRHRKDRRILFWNLMNEPGYNHHGKVAAPVLRRMFEIAWEIDPDQPAAADLFATLGRGKENPAEGVAAECSDIVSYHCYRDFAFQVTRLDYLRKRFGRPLINTEWMNRITNNRFQECYPLFYLAKVGAVSWGLVRSRNHPSSSEPWPSLWTQQKNGKGDPIDLTKWMHDIYRPSLRPYDPKEVELIKSFNKLADGDFAAKRARRP